MTCKSNPKANNYEFKVTKEQPTGQNSVYGCSTYMAQTFTLASPILCNPADFYISTDCPKSSSAPWTKPLCVSLQLQLPRCPTRMYDLVWRCSGTVATKQGGSCFWGHSYDLPLDSIWTTLDVFVQSLQPGLCLHWRQSINKREVLHTVSVIPSVSPPPVRCLDCSVSHLKKSDSWRRVLHVRDCCSLSTESTVAPGSTKVTIYCQCCWFFFFTLYLYVFCDLVLKGNFLASMKLPLQTVLLMFQDEHAFLCLPFKHTLLLKIII